MFRGPLAVFVGAPDCSGKLMRYNTPRGQSEAVYQLSEIVAQLICNYDYYTRVHIARDVF